MTIGNWILTASERAANLAVQFKKNGNWHQLNWQEYIQKVVSAYQQLKKQGMKLNTHVGLISSTRWEWSALDLAIIGSGGICVPFYPNLSDEDFLYTINHAEIELLIIETEELLAQISRISSRFERQVKIIPLSEIDFDTHVDEKTKKEYFLRCEKIKEKEIATIIYTSGTTGKPKGVVLLHEAIVSEVTDGYSLFNLKPNYKSLTFLPFAHVLGRIEHWGSLFSGHSLAYAESIEKLKSNLTEIKPDFIIAVPRIFEKVYGGIMAQIETNKIKTSLFNEAQAAAAEVQKYRKSKSTIPWTLLLKYEALNRIAFAPIRSAFGGNLKFAVSGGAPLDSYLTQFFFNCGVPILEGYGLSETTGAVTINALNDYEIGTVGKPIGDVEIKFAADGEILIKSKKCLTEYYKNPEETEKSIQKSFFATGDIGEFTSRGFLKITDRKKDLIKTAGGKYVAPQKLEGLMKQEPLVSQVLIHGDQKKYIVALISLDEAQIARWAESQHIKFTDASELYSNIALKLRIQKHVQSINSGLASFEAIKKFEIVPDAWTIENGFLTPSLKVKRKLLESKYASLLNEIYE